MKRIIVATLVVLCTWAICASAQVSKMEVTPKSLQKSTIKTEYLMSYFVPISAERIKIDDATAITEGYSAGSWIKGPRISGKFVGPGVDTITVTPSGVSRLDVRFVIETDDKAIIYMTYGGISVSSEKANEALSRGEVMTDKTWPYLITAPTFRTSSKKYDWLNQVQAVGKMVEFKRDGQDSYIKYDVFIVR